MLADVRIRREPYYRREAIEQGLKRLGYAVGACSKPKQPHDALVLWGRKNGADDAAATAWERAGGLVLVMENGYLQRVDKTLYAVSVGQHHAGGPVGVEDRFGALGFEVKPWRSVEDGHMLVCGQRGIGSPVTASPQQWAERRARELQKMGLRTRLRLHPGNHAPPVPVMAELMGARACAIWASNVGVRALVEGVPVVYSAPEWICAGAACRGANVLGYGDVSRAAALQRMAHGQWSVPELASGEPFARILEARKC